MSNFCYFGCPNNFRGLPVKLWAISLFVFRQFHSICYDFLDIFGLKVKSLFVSSIAYRSFYFIPLLKNAVYFIHSWNTFVNFSKDHHWLSTKWAFHSWFNLISSSLISSLQEMSHTNSSSLCLLNIMMMNSTNIEASTKLNKKQFKVFQSYFANSNSSSNHSCFQASKLFTDEY